MTAGKYFSKITFQCKCLIFYFYLFLNSFTKEMPGEWTLWHYCISRKFGGYTLYVRTIDICGYGYGYGYGWQILYPRQAWLEASEDIGKTFDGTFFDRRCT